MLHALRKRRRTLRSLNKVTGIFAGAAVLFSLPLFGVIAFVAPTSILGIDGGFFLTLFMVPLILGLVLWLSTERIDDVERQIRIFENE